MKTRLILLTVALSAAAAVPASAGAATVSGVVVARDGARGTLVFVGRGGSARTLRAPLAHARLGDRLVVSGARLVGRDLAGRARVVGHLRRATVHGVVLRQLLRRTLVSSGGAVLSIRRARAARRLASVEHGGLRPGDVARFEVDISAAGLTQVAVTAAGSVSTVRIEGSVVSASPFVVSVGGLPVAISVPAGMTLPASVAPGARVEATVSLGAANAFTLASVDEVEGAKQANPEDEDEDEVEARGGVVSSTPGQLVIATPAGMLTFTPPGGVTLPTLPAGTIVEVKGLRRNGLLLLVRLRVEDDDEDEGSSGTGGDGDHSGPGGGDDGGSARGGDDD